MAAFNALAAQYPAVDFAVVYIEEAHPTDGWVIDVPKTPIDGKDDGAEVDLTKLHVNKHRRLEDRLEAARLFITECKSKMNVYVDTMSDEANWTFGALFERLYVIKDGKIVVQGERGPSGYDMSVVSEWLEKNENKVVQ